MKGSLGSFCVQVCQAAGEKRSSLPILELFAKNEHSPRSLKAGAAVTEV